MKLWPFDFGRRRRPDPVVVTLPPESEYGEYCFLCLRAFSDSRLNAPEHIFPRWLLGTANLYKHPTRLPNGMSFDYSQRRVPCCKDCNSWLNDTLEKPVRAGIVGQGPSVDPSVLLLWMAKIYYGTLFRELGLRADMKGPTSEMIRTPEELLPDFDFLRTALIAGPEGLHQIEPIGSLLQYRAGVPPSVDERFDFFIVGGVRLLVLRVSSHVLVASFGYSDHLTQRLQTSRVHEVGESLELHPVQVWDVAAVYAAIIREGLHLEVYEGWVEWEDLSERTPIETDLGDDLRAQFYKEALMQIISANPLVEAFASVLKTTPSGSVISMIFEGPNMKPIQAECFALYCPAFLQRFGLYRDEPCPDCRAAPSRPTPNA